MDKIIKNKTGITVNKILKKKNLYLVQSNFVIRKSQITLDYCYFPIH